ncbi:MAG: hypothetical protein ACK5B9_09855 [Flavobacteriia bacterium]|jgi:hypothetical protein
MRISLILLILSLSACVHDYNYKSVEPYYLFHDNSSKVWVINHVFENGKDLSPLSLNYKKILVFHSSGYCYEYSIEGLGTKKGRKGSFNLKIDEKDLEIAYKKETIHFKIEYLTEKKIILKTKNKDKQEVKIELVTFPEY